MRVGLSLCVSGVLAGSVLGQVIDFETLPDGVTAPVDEADLPVTAEYEVDGVRVRFGSDSNGDGMADTPLVFELVGDADAGSGFSYFLGGPIADTPATGFEDRMGDWFLKAGPGGSFRIVIDYDQDVSAASGEVWDIDGRLDAAFFEQWRARALSVDGTVIDEAISPPGVNDALPFDGEPWVFVLTGETIRRVVLDFVGNLPGAAGVAFDNFRATESIPGPVVLTQQPDHLVKDPLGIDDVRLYWSEAVELSAADVSVVTTDAGGQPVPFVVSGSGTQVTTIVFTGAPGGVDTGAAVPLRLGAYRVTVRDSALSVAGNVPIDGDSSGVSGGDAVVTVRHGCEADLRPSDGVLDLADVDAFIDAYVSNCAGP